MHPKSKITEWCERALEYGWLLCIGIIPSYFNLLSARHFEPDKAVLFRAFVTVLCAIAAVHWIHQRSQSNTTPATFPIQRSFLSYSIVAYCAIFLFATVTSIVPGISFWGSYQRLQGTYTNLSYVALALIIVAHIRTVAQLWRMVGMVLFSALVPTLYGFVQHYQSDPLPWKGDVITRVASTMGNSIFIAAFLILTVPYALAYGFTLLRSAQQSSKEPADAPSLGTLLVDALTIGAAVAIVFAAIQFSGVVRSIDLRFWWVYPGALLSTTIAYISILFRQPLPIARPLRSILPALIATVYAIALLINAQPSDEVKIMPPTDGRFGANWSLWLLSGVILLWVAVILPILQKTQPTTDKRYTRFVGWMSFVFAATSLVTIFFTQSRGPWIGGAVGIVFFVTVLLIDIRRRNGRYARLATRLFVAQWTLVGLLLGFLLLFNFSQAPIFTELRTVPYIGRMGKLFDVSAGTTGDVRMKIWFGDEFGTGTIGLITSDPLRTIIGWGPESMFVAYNAFYPPSLANIESRSASPDRSHEAFLDELVNKGLLGLFSYLALISGALIYGFRLLKQPTSAPHRFLVIAAMSTIVAHNVEGLTGIPVVTSLMMQWVSIGVLFVVGRLSAEPASPLENPVSSEPVAIPQSKSIQTGRRRPQTQSQRPVVSRQQPLVTDYLIYAAVLAAGVYGAWSYNLDNALADMRFQQGTSYAEAATNSGNTDQQIIGLSYFLDAMRMEPSQDYYYLSAGRSLLNLADAKRRIGGNRIESQDTSLRELLSKESAIDIKDYLEPRSTRDIVHLAEQALLEAHSLNQYNKDHFANLARLYTFWYNRVEQTPAVEAAIMTWFEKGVSNAPNDVSILNEYIGALITRANRLRDTNPSEAALTRERAHAALERSQMLDPAYANTAIRVADLTYADGRYSEALPLYAAIIQKDPHALDSQISTIVDELAGSPALLKQLRTAYLATPYQNDRLLLSILGLISSREQNYPEAISAFGQLVAIQPDSIEALQNYTIVLSNGLEYQNASIQAQNLVALAAAQQLPAETVALYQQLADYLVAKIP